MTLEIFVFLKCEIVFSGEAFRDLPPGLYPTVGLQTPGEQVDANFGQQPFVFDIEGEMIAAK